MPTVFFPKEHTQISVASGTLLLDAIRNAGLSVDAPCGGRGTCKKCTVMIENGRAAGIRQSCRFTVTEDISVLLSPSLSQEQILGNGDSKREITAPNLTCVHAVIPKATINDPFSVSMAIKKALGEHIRIPLSVLSNLYTSLEQLEYEGEFVLFQDTLIGVRPSHAPVYVLAYDIGTTTVVSYLLDALTGKQISVSGVLNPQTAYGADVISRCEYDLKNPEHTLTRIIRTALNSLAIQNAEKAGISPLDICFAVIAGNTCMQHLYLGVSTTSLIRAPYMATVDELQLEYAADFGLSIHPLAKVCTLPSIAGFVGGDTVGVLLSLPENTFSRCTLILDIGTNGELVLGHHDKRYTCSTAAGPAFEGAKISCGMRGASGAIDHVSLKDSQLVYSVIGNTVPSGICGSGLIDLIACLLKLDIISSRGRINRPEKWTPEAVELYSHRFTKRDGVSAFLLTDDESGIYLTQKDIREVQLAKAAIATGIELLCQKMEISVSEIQSVLLAGAFGNYLSPKSACQIGLIPSVLLNRIQSIGNAAGEGAKLAALSRDVLESSCSIAKETSFVELASSREFQTAYLNRLNF